MVGRQWLSAALLVALSISLSGCYQLGNTGPYCGWWKETPDGLVYGGPYTGGHRAGYVAHSYTLGGWYRYLDANHGVYARAPKHWRCDP